ICDLPYGVLNEGNVHTQWDNVIPFDMLWKQYERVIKDNGAIILFGSGMFTADLMQSNRKLWRYNLIWHKDRATGFLNAAKMPLRCHEDLCIFYKSLPTYNPQMEDLNGREPSHSQGYGIHKQTNQCYGNVHRIQQYEPKDPNKKYPQSIIKMRKEHDDSQFHPTQKPVDLLRYLIRTYSNEGDTILDNCMGSGTTAVACIKEKRHFIGFELNKEYFDKACQRIDAEQRQLTLF
ncbi:MAG: site-specific DNA-methyltransferase, partial [Paludibacteraceae bacterium]|nr:site-specific DNA-methyltransferase [Paludibacteraceae bacterium]